MSSLDKFIKSKNQPLASGQSQSSGRASAQSLKVPIPKSKTSLPAHPRRETSTTPPAVSSYAAHPAAERNFVPNQHGIYDQQHNAPRDTFADDTVGSDFDRTRSDLAGFEGHEGPPPYGHNGHSAEDGSDGYSDVDTENGEHDNAENRRAISHSGNGNEGPKLARQSKRSPVFNNNEYGQALNHGGQSSNVNNRFAKSQHGQTAPQQINVPVRQSQTLSFGQGDHGHSEEDMNRQESFDVLPSQVNSQSQKLDTANNGLDGSVGEEIESPIDDGPVEYVWPDGIDQKPDYTPEQLENMQYEDLKKETWETERHRKRPIDLDEGQASSRPLNDRLEEVLRTEVELPIDEAMTVEEADNVRENARQAIAKVQFEFFTDLPITEWEKSGEFLIERMGEIMKKMVVARRSKREMVSAFEDRIEKREFLVRDKSEHLDGKLKDMKQSGLGLLKGNSSS